MSGGLKSASARQWVHRFVARQTGAAVDDALLRLMMADDRLPAAADIARLREEVEATRAYYKVQGYLEDPARFHVAPSAPPTLEVSRGWMPRLAYERVSFESGYVPDARPALRNRWLAHIENRTACAYVLRHPDQEPRPWLICLHGLGTGRAWMDLPAFRAERLHLELGINMLFPVLPLHGRRRPPDVARGGLVSFELMDTLHGLAQAVWDSRRLLRWLRNLGAERVGVFGLSLGAYAASLLAGLEDVDLAMAGIPVGDIPLLFKGHAGSDDLPANALPTEALADIYKVISPAAIPIRTPVERRFIFAGVSDRITPPLQATTLWEAWEKPALEWFDGGHVSFFWTRGVGRFVDRILEESGFVGPEARSLLTAGGQD